MENPCNKEKTQSFIICSLSNMIDPIYFKDTECVVSKLMYYQCLNKDKNGKK